MINRKIFFDEYRKSLDPNRKLDQKEVNAIGEFINFVDQVWSDFTIPQWAYILATTFHETKATFLPVKEACYLQENYNWSDAKFEDWAKRNFRYFPYYGRGYVQITWLKNYQYFEKLMGLPLVQNPTLAMVPKTAFFIMVHGFKKGTFTGKKITDYISGPKKDYKGARKCINGTDKDELIKTYAILFEKILLRSTK